MDPEEWEKYEVGALTFMEECELATEVTEPESDDPDRDWSGGGGGVGRYTLSPFRNGESRVLLEPDESGGETKPDGDRGWSLNTKDDGGTLSSLSVRTCCGTTPGAYVAEGVEGDGGEDRGAWAELVGRNGRSAARKLLSKCPPVDAAFVAFSGFDFDFDGEVFPVCSRLRPDAALDDIYGGLDALSNL